ncbi:hypothetical protein [Methylomagnum sp.]
MKTLLKWTAILALTTAAGCTSFVTQQQGRYWPGHYRDCPGVYTLTRMELSSLEWAFSDAMAPTDTCLAHYYQKARKDSFYSEVNRYLIPGFILSMPVDALLDTVTLPFADW